MPNRRELGYVSAGSTSTIPATTGYGVATGGTSSSITVSSQNYTLLTFTSDSSLVVSTAGLFDVVLFGGGGGGRQSIGAGDSGSGGGAGGYQSQTIYLTAATYVVDIGAGGAQSTAGSVTSLGSNGGLCGIGGGAGVYAQTTTWITVGGSGGGTDSTWLPQGTSLANGIQGYNGGDVTAGNAYAGGGGSSAIGGDGVGSTGGAGGAGQNVQTFIGAGSSLFKGGGGGGGGATGGAGGSSVGGAGGGTATNGSAAAANTGSGGGGGGFGAGTLGGAGGSGIMYVRFKV